MGHLDFGFLCTTAWFRAVIGHPHEASLTLKAYRRPEQSEAPLALAALGLGSATTSAAQRSVWPLPLRHPRSRWWERDNHSDAADRYWQPNRTERRRDDGAEARIQQRHNRYHLNRYDHRDDRDLVTQRRLLHYETHQ